MHLLTAAVAIFLCLPTTLITAPPPADPRPFQGPPGSGGCCKYEMSGRRGMLDHSDTNNIKTMLRWGALCRVDNVSYKATSIVFETTPFVSLVRRRVSRLNEECFASHYQGRMSMKTYWK
jgi:hypothetical protein